MSRLFLYFFCVFGLVSLSDICEAARILAFYPTPSISHQVVFRPLNLELAKRGHEVVVITADPIFPKGNAPANLTEIDVHDLSYGLMRKLLAHLVLTEPTNKLFVTASKTLSLIMEEQLKVKEVQEILNDKSRKFDLVIVEAYLDAALGLSHVFKAPIIQFSSVAGSSVHMDMFGAASHALLYPSFFRKRVCNLTLWQKLNELYDEYERQRLYLDIDVFVSEQVKRIFGEDVPTLEELRKNVDMLFLNVHPMWDFNRPVPPSVVYLGGMHLKPEKELPSDLQTYLDSSKNGVIYVSFGTNVDPGLFPPERIRTLVNVFSKLPYDVLWKWNQDELPGRTPNIRISKWLPQSDLLRHPKIKLFITQCGLQSTDEAITAGVPLLGMPVIGDQEFNAEQYIYHGIGVRVDIDSVTEEILLNGINKILQDDSYRNNIVRFRSLMNDQPQTPLERAVWWTEYVIRHSGARHLRAAGAGVSFAEYYELKLVSCVVLGILSAITITFSAIWYSLKRLFGSSSNVKKQ